MADGLMKGDIHNQLPYSIWFMSYGLDKIPNYETRSLANNLKSKNQELSSLFMTHRINAMHALIKFPEYVIRFRSYGPDKKWDVWTDRRTYGQTDVRDG